MLNIEYPGYPVAPCDDDGHIINAVILKRCLDSAVSKLGSIVFLAEVSEDGSAHAHAVQPYKELRAVVIGKMAVLRKYPLL